MTDRPRAFLAVDQGTASTSAALIGRLGGRWRLLGSAAMPVGVALDDLADLLEKRLIAADPALAADLSVGHGPLARLVSSTAPPATLAILAPTERARATLERAARGSGWRLASGSLERLGPLELTNLALDHAVGAILLGAGANGAQDDKGALRILGPLVAGLVARRPGLPVVLVGSAVQHRSRIEAARGGVTGSLVALPDGARTRAGEAVLRAALDELRADRHDSRHGLVRATATLAEILERRVEAIEIGASGGARVSAAGPVAGLGTRAVRSAIVAAAALARPEPDDALIDGIVGWSSVPVDRPRLRDRLRELWLAPWAEAHGEGALLRLTAARAALERLVAATPEFGSLPAPDVLVVAGGVWAVAPAAAVAMAVMDLVRRTGACQLLLDHARLLGPIGSIADDGDRRALLADLAEDALLPLGTTITPHGLRAGRFVGSATVRRSDGSTTEQELVAGRLVSLDVPPGESAEADLTFRDSVVLGGRGKRFGITVAGGMAGVLVDLRDVPLRLPDRLDRRRELLTAWQGPLWSPLEA